MVVFSSAAAFVLPFFISDGPVRKASVLGQYIVQPVRYPLFEYWRVAGIPEYKEGLHTILQRFFLFTVYAVGVIYTIIYTLDMVLADDAEIVRSTWLRIAKESKTIESNGKSPISWGGVARSCLVGSAVDRWAYNVMYEPLKLMKRFPLRTEKYYWATVSSVQMIQHAFGKTVSCTRHLHRHAILTCYLDGIVDTHHSLAWPLQFGLAIFGMRSSLPDFLDEHDETFRAEILHDYPRLKLAAQGEHKDLIVSSLLEAAAIEASKNQVPHLEHKLLSNLVCIRPFLISSGLVDSDLMEPLAMIYTFFDDALDVLEDGPGTHMFTEQGVERATGLVRTAVREINLQATGGDWKDLADSAIAFARSAALAQIRCPEQYKTLESGVFPICVRLTLTIFVLNRIGLHTR